MLNWSSVSNSTIIPSYTLLLFAPLLALFLSIFLVLIYDKTSKDVVRQNHFIQSLILFAIVTTTIMQSIGDSLATSFGIFGALAIIRFRLRISSPRDVAFIFATMAIGIACGVHSFINAIAGTLLFGIVVILLRMTPFGRKNNIIGHLRFQVESDTTNLESVRKILDQHSENHSIKNYRIYFEEDKKKGMEYEYELHLLNEQEGITLSNELKKNESISNIRLTFQNITETQL